MRASLRGSGGGTRAWWARAIAQGAPGGGGELGGGGGEAGGVVGVEGFGEEAGEEEAEGAQLGGEALAVGGLGDGAGEGDVEEGVVVAALEAVLEGAGGAAAAVGGVGGLGVAGDDWGAVSGGGGRGRGEVVGEAGEGGLAGAAVAGVAVVRAAGAAGGTWRWQSGTAQRRAWRSGWRGVFVGASLWWGREESRGDEKPPLLIR